MIALSSDFSYFSPANAGLFYAFFSQADFCIENADGVSILTSLTKTESLRD